MKVQGLTANTGDRVCIYLILLTRYSTPAVLSISSTLVSLLPTPCSLPIASPRRNSSSRMRSHDAVSTTRTLLKWLRRPGRPCVSTRSVAASRSASTDSTVSLASGMLVPTMPLGPRFTHPLQYTPDRTPLSSTTRPASDGNTLLRVSHGSPDNGSPLKRTERNTSGQLNSSKLPTPTAFCSLGAPSNRVRSKRIPFTQPVPSSTTSVGCSRNRR
mmetsp:Transcript_61890/g.134455  ORF Transcript_61890/g.134455 Transcript_61890/m.134455 type:complete len:215 (-) Transcript_61890:127-771(-)